jgi:CRP-like cAMP-binding protein
MSRLAESSIERHMGPDRTLVAQSEPFPYLGVVLDGSIVASFLTADGRDHLLYEIPPPETFAEIPMVDEHGALTTLASGPDGALVVLVPRADVEAACRIDARLSFQIARVTAARARTLARSVGSLAFTSTTRRVARVIRSTLADDAPGKIVAPHALRSLSQAQIAVRAGTVRVVAARALHALAESGAIELDGGRIVAVDTAILSRRV